MQPLVYLSIFIAMLVVGGLIGIPVTIYFTQQRNLKTASTHVQVCALSKSVDKTYYLCDPPVNGGIIIREKRTVADIEGESKGIYKERKIIGVLLDMEAHVGYYPQTWRRLQAPIKEYYADVSSGSFIPLSFGNVDPLEIASRLIALINQTTIKTIVRESTKSAEEAKKTNQSLASLKMLPVFVIAGAMVNILLGVVVYLTVKGYGPSLTTILNGLKSVGIIP